MTLKTIDETTMNKRCCRVRVSRELLLSLLALPSNTELVDVRIDNETFMGNVTLVVSSPSFPETRIEGAAFPFATPIIDRLAGDRGYPRFIGWNFG